VDTPRLVDQCNASERKGADAQVNIVVVKLEAFVKPPQIIIVLNGNN
jgi:hypothetical protein